MPLRRAAGLDGVEQGVGLADQAQGLADEAALLAHVDQAHGQVARAVQQAKCEGGDQHHIARRDLADLPQVRGPDQGGRGHDNKRHVIGGPDFLIVHPAAAVGVRLSAERLGQAGALAVAGGEGLHRQHVVDHVHHLAPRLAGALGVVAVAVAAPQAEGDQAGGGGSHEGRQGGRHPTIQG